MNKPHTGELIFFWILFGSVGLLAFVVMSPYFTSLFLAGVFTIIFSPVHKRMLRYTKNNDGLASFFTVLLVLGAILVPLILLGFLLFQEVLAIYGSLAQGDMGFSAIDHVLNAVQSGVRKLIPSFTLNANIYVYIENALKWVALNLNTFFSGILSFLFQVVLVVVAMFFLYRDGAKLRAFAVKWSPLADSYDESIISKIEIAVSSVVKGALTTAIAQGVLVGIGFTIFGVPNPVLWGSVATVAALIPLLGTGLITMPAAVWLLLGGHMSAGIGLIVWGLFCVGLIDNFLSPYMMKRGIDIHPLLILLSVFGGLTYFGPVGFLAGPIVLAFFFALLDIYPAIIHGKAVEDDGTLLNSQ